MTSREVGTVFEGVAQATEAAFTAVDAVSKFIPSAKTIGNVTEAVAPFLPLVGIVSALTKEMLEAYENVQYNKKTCGILVNRVEAAETSIKALIRQKEENFKKFQNQNYFNTFMRFVNCLKAIKKLFDDISQLPKFKKFVLSSTIRDRFENSIKEFDSCSNDLNLAISIATQDQMSKDLKILHEDMVEMNKFLNKVEGGITITVENTETIMNKLEIQNNEIKIITEYIAEQKEKEQNKRLTEMNQEREPKTIKFASLNREIDTISLLNKQAYEPTSTLKAKQIEASELTDSPKYEVRQGSRVKIQKKIYNALEVACKPISGDNVQKIQKHLAILERLEVSPYIIIFYGLSEIATERVMVFEWAEQGTLKEVYEKYTIDWEAKISIARDICRGLAFLQSVKILHHDIRCENVLITDKIQPKLCNFKFAREFGGNTTQIDNINALIHWLAPEKLSHIQTQTDKDKKSKKTEEARYTIQCEIFSFGMLLWELGFQRIPYENKSMLEIQKHVLEGKRETLNFGLSPSPIQKEYGEIIKLAWKPDPSLRPGIQQLFNMLQETYEKNILNKGSPLMRPFKERENSVGDEDLDGLYIPESEGDDQTETIIVPVPPIPVKEGLQAHKEGNYEKAWKCFDANANIGDILAIYWQGYYYLEGRHVPKDKSKAMESFKKAADAGNADAQLRYAFCLIDKENKHIDSAKFMKYLQLAADNNNATALYNLGDVYFSGKLGIERNREKGIHYLKQAALHKQAKAKEILDKNNISIY